MISIFTSKHYTDNTVISDIHKHFKEEIMEAVANGDINFEDEYKELLEELNVDYSEKELDKLPIAVKAIMILKYEHDKESNNILDIYTFIGVDEKEILKYADKYNSNILSIKLDKELYLSRYTYLINDETMVFSGNELAAWFFNIQYGKARYRMEQPDELVFQANNCLFCFNLKQKNTVIKIDTDIEKDFLMRQLRCALRESHINNRYVMPVTKDTLIGFEKHYVEKLNIL